MLHVSTSPISQGSSRNEYNGNLGHGLGSLLEILIGTFQKVGTHVDSLIAEAALKGFRDFDLELAYEAVHKDATVPPENDWNTS